MMFGKPLNHLVYSNTRILLEECREHRHIRPLFNSQKELTHSSQTSRGPASQIQRRTSHK